MRGISPILHHFLQLYQPNFKWCMVKVSIQKHGHTVLFLWPTTKIPHISSALGLKNLKKTSHWVIFLAPLPLWKYNVVETQGRKSQSIAGWLRDRFLLSFLRYPLEKPVLHLKMEQFCQLYPPIYHLKVPRKHQTNNSKITFDYFP